MKLSIVFLVFTLHLSKALFSEVSHKPLFHNGRPKGGFLGNPYVDPRMNLKAAEPQWFKQKLNHFDEQDMTTWQQKYYVNASVFGIGGPVFLMIGGEGPLSANWVAVGAMVELAKEHNALILALEHRFYGESHPTRSVVF